ncbi:DNA repair protein rad14 [Rhizina undulata]
MSSSGNPSSSSSTQRPPLDPEQVRRIETNRLKAKAIYEARIAQEQSLSSSTSATAPDATFSNSQAGQKRPFSEISSSSRKGGENRDSLIKPARKFAKYVEYELSKMTDTKGGFISTEDDPHSTLAAVDLQDKPAHMSLEDWSKHQLRVKMQKEKVGVYEPAISALKSKDEQKKCFECGSLEIDWKWQEVFGCRVCGKCKDEKPEKYSLLTKTECREDYLLTDPELKDEELLPHIEKPNPHKSTWNNMMLYVRYQVEAHALKKWGSLEALDKEFEKRTAERKKRKDEKFCTKLRELKKKTRVESWKRNGGGSTSSGKHEHVYGPAVVKGDTGESIRTCEECGFEIEELVF